MVKNARNEQFSYLAASHKRKYTLPIIAAVFAVACMPSGFASAASITAFSVSSPTIDINLSPSASGSSSSQGSHTATIQTNCESGYKVYVSMSRSSTDNKLHLDGQSSNTTAGTNAIGPTAGSISSGSDLSTNSWGVKVGSETKFGAVPLYSDINRYVDTASSNPPALITSSSAASSGANYTITYGANASSSLTPGDYKGEILYTAIMNSSCYTSSVTLNKDEYVENVSGVVSGEVYPIGSTQTVTCTPARIHTCSWYKGATQVSTGDTYTFTVPEEGITLTARSVQMSVTASQVEYTNNGQTTVQGALDDLYDKLN